MYQVLDLTKQYFSMWLLIYIMVEEFISATYNTSCVYV